MDLVQPTLIDLIHLTANARDDEVYQYEQLVGEWDVDEVAHSFWQRSGVKFGLRDVQTDVVVCAGGWEPVIQGVYQSWMVGTEEYWDKYWRSITKNSRRIMDLMFSEFDARRLQTAALESRGKACEWYVRGLKMKPEAIIENFGFNGENMATFVRIKEASENG